MGRYLKAFLIGFFLITAFATVVNYSVNPYDYWDVPRVDGFNAYKPEFGSQQGIAKPEQLHRAQPDIVIMGNSRVQVGFDPHMPSLDGHQVYNLGLPGYGLSQQFKALKRARREPGDVTLYVGLDFLDFRISKEEWQRPEGRQSAHNKMELRRYAELLWSITAVSDSVKTVLAQSKSHPMNVTAQGFNPVLEFQAFVDANGYGQLFDMKEKDYFQDAAARPKRTGWESPGFNTEWRALDQLIIWAEEEGIDIVFFSHPYHVSFLNIMEQVELWPAFENWKKLVRQKAQSQDIPFWDFSVLSLEVIEAVKPATPMVYYWEAGHYKSAMGALMMAHMRGGEGFGVLLNGISMETHLTAQRLALQRYNDAHPKDARRLKEAKPHLPLRKSTSEFATK